VAAGDGEEHQVEHPHDEVGDAEHDAIDVERVRGREGHDEHGGHRAEHRDAHHALLGIERVREPGVGRPRPPQRAEQEEPAEQPIPRRVMDEEPGDLGDGEDEDQVEEELEIRDALV
jgi:hypothetical protein